ncbi:MAG: RNA 2'-phosphotransferase [Rhizobiaceae bacterium]|nr:RNA 2'-phosphotransferase [Rhizobiaceae bacterium]
MPATDTEISKFMSYVLRHAPHELELTLTEDGWTDYAALSEKLCRKLGVTDADIRRVIDENAKKRFTLAGGRIRAAQGHSVSVDLALKPEAPPALLYHGTTGGAWAAIRETGLKPMDRTHVHLSPDLETARAVARRRKGPHVLLKVDAAAMHSAGMAFFVADNGVWLTHEVPPAHLSIVPETSA